MTMEPRAKLLYGNVAQPEHRARLEEEIGQLLNQGYRIAEMTQGDDETGSYVTVLLTTG